MMRWLVGSSLRFRALVVGIAAGVIVLGITQLPRTPVDTLPEFKRPTVEVQTEALGLSAEEVEQFITVPLEQDLLNGVAFLDEIRSASLPGLSSVVMVFEPGTDILDARQVVAERLTQAVGAAGLPEVAKPPQMLQPLSSTSRVAMVRLVPEELSPIEVSVLARWVIVPRLLGVPGVANVSIWGFRDRQLQVLVDPARLREAGVTLEHVIRTAGNALEVSPLTFLEASTPGTGGWIDTVNQRLQVFHEQAIRTPEDLARVPLEDPEGRAVFVDGEPLTLGDVTEVVEDHQPLIGDAHCGGERCLLLVVEKFPGANTPEVARGVEEALDVMRPGLEGMSIDTAFYRPAEYIAASFANLARSLAIAGAIVILLLGLLFLDPRRTAISAAAIALSLAAAWVVLFIRRDTVNLMVVAGLAAGLGIIVQDAVLDAASLARRLRRHHEQGSGVPVWRAISDACLEMRRAAVYGGLIVVAATVPVFLMEREAGAFLPPIAASLLLAMGASVLVGLTVTPALGLLLLDGSGPGPREAPVLAWLGRAYGRVSSRVVGRPAIAMAVLGLALAVGLAALPFLDVSVRPALRERDVLVRLEAPPGTSLPRMDGIVAGAIRDLSEIPGVAEVGAHVGRAITSDQIVNVNSGEIWVSIDPAAPYGGTLAAIRGVMEGYPEVASEVTTYSSKRVSDLLGGSGDDLVVRVYGEDPATLRRLAEEVRGAMANVGGIGAPRIVEAPEEPVIEVQVDVDRAQRFGVKPGDVRRTAAILLSGITVGQLFEEQKVFDVVVWGTPELRRSEEDVRGLLIDAPTGGQVPLERIADVRTVPNPTVILHDQVMTYLDVTADLSGRDPGAVARDVDRALDRIRFPLEYHAEVLGDAVERAAARTRVLLVAAAAAIVIFLLLQAAFTSWRLAVLAFATLPMALAGGAVAAALAGGTLGLGSVAGLLALIGIGARGTLVLFRRYQELERREGIPFGADLVLRGSREEVGPLLASTVVAACALLPFALRGGEVGFEIVGQAAVVLLGGLVSSALLHAVVAPALYLRFGYVARPDTTAEDLVVTIPEIEPVRRG
ncbi:MAG TPA: efflux RND transporter permease subunit [Actinomycetota bacterium]|nr:efflux RND transporter permease subunit [Actinomycetota bacterium]